MVKKKGGLKDELGDMKYDEFISSIKDELRKVLTEKVIIPWRWFKLWEMILEITEY